jgi:glycolate oxidase iron-sulfur subunit
MLGPMNVPPERAPNPATWFDSEDAPGRRDLETCIHCGLCLTACPTYRVLKIEPDSPRGRIYLMRGLAEGRIAPSDALVTHLDNCLDCRACETVCPAGVPYSRMLEETRGQLARRAGGGSFMSAVGRWVLLNVIPHRDRVHGVADLLRVGQSGPAGAFMRSAFARRVLPAFATRGFETTPALAPRHERMLENVARALPSGARMERTAAGLVFHPTGAAKARVDFFMTCVMEAMFPVANRETVRLMVLAGAEVRVPEAQTCCGALHAHSGLRRAAKDLARRNVRTFGGDADFIVTHSAGCGAALRETGHLLDDDAASAAAAKFASRVRDVSEVLAELGLPEPATPLHARDDASRPLRVAYHDPCHLAHGQKVRSAPRELLKRTPGVALVELPQSDWCCGSAGVYNLTHPEMADAQLEGKLDAIASVAPEVVVASNPGCQMHMARGAAARHAGYEIVHLVELLGRAHAAPRSPAGAPERRS